MTDVITLGPAKDSTASYYSAEQDRWIHTIRQSTLSSFAHLCAESVRLDMAYPERRRETSQAAIGTAVHAGIEYAINEKLRLAWPLLKEMYEVAIGVYMPLFNSDGFRQGNKDLATNMVLIREALEKFMGQIRPELQPLVSEQTFKGITLYEDAERIIYANGTIDYIDENGWMGDFKTSGRTWTGSGGSAYEKRRWDPQSVLYHWAAVEMDLIPQDAEFKFMIMVHGKPAVEWLSLPARYDRLMWTQQLALDWALMNEAQLPRWPRNDGHNLCSETFCNHWSECKGKFTKLYHDN